MKNSCC